MGSSSTGIHGRVLQGVVTAPLQIFNLFISKQSKSNHTLVGDFADENAIIAASPYPNLGSLYFRDHLNVFGSWYIDWEIKINET